MFPKIRDGLQCFETWCVKNSLKLNARKSKALILGPTSKISSLNLDTEFSLNGQSLEYVNVYNYLGITLDQKMTLLPLLSKLKNVITHKIYSMVKIRDFITTKCALTIYKQTILPLFDYSGFITISCNVSDRLDLQTLQNNALRVCYNVKLRDRVAVKGMHDLSNLLSLEQRRQFQVLNLMFIYKNRHNDVQRIYNRVTRGANVFSFIRERYNCTKYRSSPYYKGSVLWDGLPHEAKRCVALQEFKKCLKKVYRSYNEKLS